METQNTGSWKLIQIVEWKHGSITEFTTTFYVQSDFAHVTKAIQEMMNSMKDDATLVCIDSYLKSTWTLYDNYGKIVKQSISINNDPR